MFSDDISMEFDLEKCASASSQENKLVLTGNILTQIKTQAKKSWTRNMQMRVIAFNGNKCCHLDKGTLYACLLGQSTTFLIEKFCRLENQMRFAKEKLGELWSLTSLAEGLGKPNLSAAPNIQVCYTQSFIEKREKAWNFLFFHALKGNHVLENVVVSFVFIMIAKIYFLISSKLFSS